MVAAGGSYVSWRSVVCWEGSTAEGWVYSLWLLEGLLILALGRSVVAGRGYFVDG